MRKYEREYFYIEIFIVYGRYEDKESVITTYVI